MKILLRLALPVFERMIQVASTGGRQAHLDALVSHELHAGAPVLSPAPVPRRSGAGLELERMQQATSPTRLRGCFPVPLTLVLATCVIFSTTWRFTSMSSTDDTELAPWQS